MKQLFKKSVVLLAILVGLSSCEGYRCARGMVLDADTKLPIDSVNCIVISGTKSQLTKADGKFSVCNNMGGCMPCKPIEIKFSKQGYKDLVVVNPTDTVFYLAR